MSVKLTVEQLKALGMTEYATETRQTALMTRIGKVVFDGAMVRLLSSLTEEQMLALNFAIENCQTFDDVIAYVERVYPQFGDYLKEEQAAFIEAYVEQLQHV